MPDLKLYMLILGCTPPGRLTEQHDVFFGIATSTKELVPHILKFWPEAKKDLHVDAWREVTRVGDFKVQAFEKNEVAKISSPHKLFFLNLGGYKAGELDEFHYKIITVGESSSEAIKDSKKTAFYKHMGIKGATSHIDEKYGLDVDDMYRVDEVLSPFFKENFDILISPIDAETQVDEDQIHLGYFLLKKL